jgi:hypothetical protein
MLNPANLVLRLVAVFIVATCCSVAAQNSTAKTPESLAFHCFDKPFVSVSARTRGRDTIPVVQLSLSDPLGRRQGKGVRGRKIPTSNYGEVTQVRSAQQRSRARAIEICDAKQGVYELRVEEHGSEAYVLDVSGQAPDTDKTDSLLLHHIAVEGRTRTYKFTFKIEKRQVIVRWLDRNGNEQIGIENNEW